MFYFVQKRGEKYEYNWSIQVHEPEIDYSHHPKVEEKKLVLKYLDKERIATGFNDCIYILDAKRKDPMYKIQVLSDIRAAICSIAVYLFHHG